MLSNRDDCRLMVGGSVDRAQTVSTCRHSASDISGKNTVLSGSIQSLANVYISQTFNNKIMSDVRYLEKCELLWVCWSGLIQALQ